MSASVERHIPRSRRPLASETSPSTQHPIWSFVVTDERWKRLEHVPSAGPLRERTLQRLVLKTCNDVYSLTYGELLQRAQALDEQIPRSPYLRSLASRGSTLIDLHDVLSEIFSLEDPADAQKFERVPPRILQINYAGRLMGRRLEEAIGWDPRYGFGEMKDHAQAAITLCSDVIKEVTPPYI